MSLQVTEMECAANAAAPRVSLKDVEEAIGHRFDIVLGPTIKNYFKDATFTDAIVQAGFNEAIETLNVFSMCVLIMRNGFTVIGKSAPASPENYDKELGFKLAYEDAVRQIWPLMGFNLKQELYEGENLEAIFEDIDDDGFDADDEDDCEAYEDADADVTEDEVVELMADSLIAAEAVMASCEKVGFDRAKLDALVAKRVAEKKAEAE